MRRKRNPFQKLERERRVAPISLFHRRERKKNKQKLEKRREGLGEQELLGRGDKNKKYI